MPVLSVPKASLIEPSFFLYMKWHTPSLICLFASSIRSALLAPISAEPVLAVILSMCVATSASVVVAVMDRMLCNGLFVKSHTNVML